MKRALFCLEAAVASIIVVAGLVQSLLFAFGTLAEALG